MLNDPYRALYLHIPYCVKRCAYCDFCTEAVNADDPVIDEYIDSLVVAIRRACKEGLLGSIETVYVGGGTPSYLGLSRLSMLLYTLSLSMHLTPEVECTMEANPDSLDERMINDIWALGVNRLSIGVQSFDDDVLAVLGRAHNAQAAKRAVSCAHKRFENVSVDLMCGIPGQSVESFADSVKQAIELGVSHVSVYPLAIEESTPFHRAVSSGAMPDVDEDVQAECMQLASSLLQRAGFHRYEVASYAQPGFESRHNTAYWTGVPYLGLGRSAVTMMQGDWGRRRVQDGETVDELTCAQAAAEDLMLGMRRSCGVPFSQVEGAERLFGGAWRAFEGLEARGLVSRTDDRIVPTELGWLCGNELYGPLLFLCD